MPSNNSHFLEDIFIHLVNISKGECTITDEIILSTTDDLQQKILSGLIYLYEDLQLYKKDVVKSVELEYKMKALEERNKELSQFTYVASHDLQEPLKTITSFIDLYSSTYESNLDCQAKQYLQFITVAAQR